MQIPTPSPNQQTPKKDAKPTSRSTRTILIIIGALVLVASAALFGLSEWNKSQTASLTEKEVTAQNAIRDMENKKDFLMFRQSKEFIANLELVRYASYGAAIYDIVKTPALVRSLQIQTDIEDNTQAHKAYLLLESYPPLSNAAALLDTFTKTSLFSKAYLSSISTSRSEAGQVIFSYPVNLTLSTRGNDTAK